MRLSGLEGRVAVVTGAASGIGRAVVHRLAREGVRLAVVDVYDAGLQRLGREPERAAVRLFAVDLTDPHEVADLADRIPREFGEVSFLVNVAGGPVAPSHQDQLPPLPDRAWPIEEIDDGSWGRILATNLTTAFLVCRAFVPGMKARGSGASSTSRRSPRAAAATGLASTTPPPRVG